MPAAKPINSGDRKVKVERVLSILRRRAWLVIPLGAAAVSATLSIVFFLPEIYRSSATVLVERPQVPEDFVRSTTSRGVDFRLQRISQEIMNRSRLLSLIDKHGLYADLRKRRPIEQVVQRMRDDIRLEIEGVRGASPREGAVAFTISYSGPDPETVSTVANELAAIYIEEDLKTRARQAAGTADFLGDQLDAIRRKLEDQERAVKDFKERYMGELPQQETANLAALERLSARLLLNSERQTLARERRVILENRLAESGTAPPTSPKAASGRPGTPYLSGRVNGMRASDAELQMLKAEEERLRSLIVAYERRIENTPRREQELRLLRRDSEATLRVYQSLLTRHEEAKLVESLEQHQKGEQFRILDPALVGERPVAPNRLRLILVGCLLSLGLVAVAAAVAETLDPSIHSADELRAVSSVPVLATIPRIVTESDRRWVARRLWVGVTSTIAGLLAIVAASYFIASQNTWLAALLC